MSQSIDLMARWKNPTREDLTAINRLTDPAIPLEQSVGRLPASGRGMMRSHHYKPVGYNALAERMLALRELADERLLESRVGTNAARTSAKVDFLRFAKAASKLQESAQIKDPQPQRGNSRQSSLDLTP